MTSIHPAVFSDNLVEPIAEMIGISRPWEGVLFDPCAGLGWKLGEIANRCMMKPLGVDIEYDLYVSESAPWVTWADSTDLSMVDDESVEAACTSFAYPNGVSDSFHAKDDSTRHTYVHRIRAHHNDPTIELRPNNMGGMNPRRSKKAMRRFYATQQMIIGEVFRVLKPDAPFVVNTKNTKYSAYTARTTEQLVIAGFHVEARRAIRAKGLNHGVGHDGKAEFEHLTLARKPL